MDAILNDDPVNDIRFDNAGVPVLAEVFSQVWFVHRLQ